MPGENDRALEGAAAKQIAQQRDETERVDRFGGRRQFVDGPPSVAAVMRAFQLLHSAGVDLVGIDAVVEEVIAEHPAGPAELGISAGVRHRVTEDGRVDQEPDLLVEFPGRGRWSVSPWSTPPPGVIQSWPS